PMMLRHMFLLVLAVFALASAAEAKRVALVIANGRYANAAELKNPAADARLIANALRNAGFESVDLQMDLGKTALENALRSFSQKAEGAEVALVYYAGHGIEAGGQNYLIPVDARLERDRDLEIEATRLETVLVMGEAAQMRIVVLDACRNNPFANTMQRTMRNRAIGRGLAAVEPEGETLVVYAAKAGATASDGDGVNSPFAQALAARLPQAGLEISLLFRTVRDDVLEKTGRVQEPFTYGSLSGKAFYFKPPTGTAAVPQGVAAAPLVSAETGEMLFWQGAMSANSEKAYRDYLIRYPKGQFAGIAQENLTRIAQPAAPRLATPKTPLPTLTANPAFDCNGALTVVKQIICNDPKLAALDRTYADLLRSRMMALPPKARGRMMQNTNALVRERDQCTDAKCVQDWYAKIGQIAAQSGGPRN
ncbi:MAG: hypothetical protein RL367_2101, partial [Pseudomonadota bacterium]